VFGVVVLACVLALAPLAGASNSVGFVDATADAPSAAPDVGGVQITNDDAGAITFRIAIPNRSALSATDLVAVFLDADGKTGTGCARGVFGAEYALDVLAGRYVFGRCANARWDFTKRPPSFSGGFSGSTLTFKVNRRDLGGPSHFSFRIGAAATTEADPAYDFAPDVGLSPWRYRVIAPPQAAMKPRMRRPSEAVDVARIAADHARRQLGERLEGHIGDR
jgi:hypothetical protein